jgi:hypothetical protein
LPPIIVPNGAAISGPDKLTIDEFFAAIIGRDGRFELIRGLAYAMAGAKEAHNVICSNVQTALVPAGKRKGYRTTSIDTAVQTGPDTVRYPDVVVDCGPPNPAALTASRPTLVVEVSSSAPPCSTTASNCTNIRASTASTRSFRSNRTWPS